jgi:hypothetical protein
MKERKQDRRPGIKVFFPIYNNQHTLERLTLKALEVLQEVAPE